VLIFLEFEVSRLVWNTGILYQNTGILYQNKLAYYSENASVYFVTDLSLFIFVVLIFVVDEKRTKFYFEIDSHVGFVVHLEAITLYNMLIGLTYK